MSAIKTTNPTRPKGTAMTLPIERIVAMRAHPKYGLVGWSGLDKAGGWSRHTLIEELEEADEYCSQHNEMRSAADAVRIALSILQALDEYTFQGLLHAALDDRIPRVEIEPLGS